MSNFDTTQPRGDTINDGHFATKANSAPEGGLQPDGPVPANAALEALTERDRETLTDSYVDAALWSSTDPSSSEPLDENYGPDDIAQEARTAMETDLNAFLTRNQEDLALALTTSHYGSYEQVGQDFWLTRNGHGAGFLTPGLDEVGERLSAAAKSFGAVHLAPGDDGLIHAL